MIKRIKKYFITGILIVLPTVISLYVLLLFFNFADGISGRFINAYFKERLGFYIPGLGIILSVLIILIVGFLSTHFFRSRIKAIDGLFSRIPFLKYIYPLLKQTIEFMLSQEHPAFKKAVLVEYPRKGVWSVGFIAAESFKEAREKTGADLENVYLPLAPNPASGMIILVPRSEIIILDVDVKEAMKLIITGGIINPE